MSNTLNYIQIINRYFYIGSLKKIDPILSAIHPSLPFKTNAGVISAMNKRNSSESTINNSVNIHVPAYNDNDIHVNKIRSYINEHLSDQVSYAFVHGSLGTNEKVNFSDFDGLLILKDSVFNSNSSIADTAIKINKSCSLMIEMDPLQHHGWFILRESDLNNWPESYFPVEILRHSKSLSYKNVDLNIKCTSDNEIFKNNLIRLISSIEKKVTSYQKPNELYSLKNLLSEFMLLPSLFLQYKTNSGIFKKHSFIEASKYFDEKEYKIMNDVSDIRDSWPEVTSSLKINSPCFVTLSLKKAQKEKSNLLTNELKVKLNTEFYAAMNQLLHSFKDKIK